MKWKWKLFWVIGLLLLWLFCSGVAQAGPLTDRLTQFPDWQSKPDAPAAEGDLAYPDWFLGNWKVTTTLVDMVAPLAPAITTPGFDGNRQFLNQPITFQVRFVEVEPHGIASLLTLALGKPRKQIVSDRAFNGMNLAKAYLGDRAVLAVKVDPDDPNRQITLLRAEAPGEPLQERQLVSTVTARAIEVPAADRFVTTEIFRQEFRGLSQIYFNDVENTTDYVYHPSDNPTTPTLDPVITADQVTAIYLSPQDPDYFKTTEDGSFWGEPHPVALYRYRMEFFPE